MSEIMILTFFLLRTSSEFTASAPRAASAPAAVHMAFLQLESSPRAEVTAAALAERVVKSIALPRPTTTIDRGAEASDVARWRMLATARADPKRNMLTGLLLSRKKSGCSEQEQHSTMISHREQSGRRRGGRGMEEDTTGGGGVGQTLVVRPPIIAAIYGYSVPRNTMMRRVDHT